MDDSSKKEREYHEAYRVSLLEKVLINFALPSDFVYHTFRALFTGDKSQTTVERLQGLWQGKVTIYRKLLRVKDENAGQIPAEYQELCSRTPCGRVRLFLALRARAKPEREACH